MCWRVQGFERRFARGQAGGACWAVLTAPAGTVNGCGRDGKGHATGAAGARLPTVHARVRHEDRQANTGKRRVSSVCVRLHNNCGLLYVAGVKIKTNSFAT